MTTESDPLDLDASEAAAALEAEAQRLKLEQDVDDFKWLMGNAQGRRFMWRLLGMTGVFRNAFTAGRDGTTEFLLGQQAIGQTMVSEIHALCPERYNTMVREQQPKKDKKQ